MNPLDYVTLALQAVVTIGGLVGQWFSAKQAPAQQAAAQAAADAKAKAQAESDVAGGDIDTIRKDAAP